MKTEVSWTATKEQSWITTYTGIKINVFDPKPEDICVTDIAHALALNCRFNGHLNKFLSVAEHSVMVSRYVSDENKLAALLHDAAEAYLTDVPRPMKAHMPAMQEVEDKLEAVILKKFGIKQMPTEVKLLDRAMCITEAKQGGIDTTDWHDTTNRFGDLKHEVQWWTWQQAELAFNQRFVALQGYLQAPGGDD
jgi:hypothetical protein